MLPSEDVPRPHASQAIVPPLPHPDTASTAGGPSSSTKSKRAGKTPRSASKASTSSTSRAMRPPSTTPDSSTMSLPPPPAISRSSSGQSSGAKRTRDSSLSVGAADAISSKRPHLASTAALTPSTDDSPSAPGPSAQQELPVTPVGRRPCPRYFPVGHAKLRGEPPFGVHYSQFYMLSFDEVCVHAAKNPNTYVAFFDNNMVSFSSRTTYSFSSFCQCSRCAGRPQFNGCAWRHSDGGNCLKCNSENQACRWEAPLAKKWKKFVHPIDPNFNVIVQKDGRYQISIGG